MRKLLIVFIIVILILSTILLTPYLLALTWNHINPWLSLFLHILVISGLFIIVFYLITKLRKLL